MLDVPRTTALLVSVVLASGGSLLVVGLLTPPVPAGGEGSDYGLDTNGNGRYDWLVVEATVGLPEAGFWDISATLLGAEAPPGGACGGSLRVLPAFPEGPVSGWPIAYAYERYFFDAGVQTVRIAFAGPDISRAGVDGPYGVPAHLTRGDGVVYYDVGIVPGPMPPSVEWSGTTAAYAASDFEEPVRPAFFTGGVRDAPVDVDSDGLYDLLEIRADVLVNEAGPYALSGALSADGLDPSGYYLGIAYAYRDVWLEAGDATVVLRFRGDQIRMAGIDGPWDFSLTLSGGILYPIRENGTALSSHPVGIYPEVFCGTTSSYRAADFDDTAELLRLTGAFGEFPEDWDGDGLYDAVRIRAEVDVFFASGFDQRGLLQSGDGTTDISGTVGQVWLPEGVAWTDWLFFGGDIRASGIDGPYLATLSITPTSGGIDPATTYRTRPYRAADFEGEIVNRTGYWISDLSTEVSGTVLAIYPTVQRGNDFLMIVVEDLLTTVVYDGKRNEMFRATDPVYLPSAGSVHSFAYKVELAPGTYTVVAVLGSADRIVDGRAGTVTL